MTCDRCGKEIVYVGWTGILRKLRKDPRKISLCKLFNGNHDGYSYLEYEKNLCSDCTKKLEEFLRGE